MATPKKHNWQHDGEYCHEKIKGNDGDSARSVCEGMYGDKEDEKERLKEALRAVYALVGENHQVKKIINDALEADSTP